LSRKGIPYTACPEAPSGFESTRRCSGIYFRRLQPRRRVRVESKGEHVLVGRLCRVNETHDSSKAGAQRNRSLFRHYSDGSSGTRSSRRPRLIEMRICPRDSFERPGAKELGASGTSRTRASAPRAVRSDSIGRWYSRYFGSVSGSPALFNFGGGGGSWRFGRDSPEPRGIRVRCRRIPRREERKKCRLTSVSQRRSLG